MTPVYDADSKVIASGSYSFWELYLLIIVMQPHLIIERE